MPAPILAAGESWRYRDEILLTGIKSIAGGREIQRWECPCDCGAYALYVRTPGAVRDDLPPSIYKIGSGGAQAESSPHVVWVACSDTLVSGELIAVGFETADEIAEYATIAAANSKWSAENQRMLDAMLELGLADALRRAMAAPAA